MSTTTTAAPVADRITTLVAKYREKGIPGVLADVKNGNLKMEDASALIDALTPKTVIKVANLSAEDFATATKLDHEGDEDKRSVEIAGAEDCKITGKPMRFSTGSVGYNLNGKVTLLVGGKPARFQVSGNLVLIGSKPGDKS